MKNIRYLATVLLLFLFHVPAWAQATPDAEDGLKPYGTFHGGDIDQVSMTNGKLLVNIPIASFSQRGGKIKLDIFVKSSMPRLGVTAVCIPHMPCNYFSTRFAGGFTVIDALAKTGAGLEYVLAGGNVVGQTYGASTPDGSGHQMGATGATYESLDGTGLRYDPAVGVLTDSAGVRYTGNTQNATPISVEDPNGNELTWNGTGWTDTLGRTITTTPATTTDYSHCAPVPGQTITSATQITIPGPTGNETFEFCNAKFPYNVTLPHANHATAGSFEMIQSIVLPNLTTWTFAYDPVYAALSQVTLPTGGTISYTYQLINQPCQWSNSHGPGGENDIAYVFTLAVATRTVNANDGAGNHQWIYGPPPTVPTAFPVTVTDPLSNDTVHVITGLGGGSSYYETQTKYYQGSSSTGTLLKTLTTDYSWTSDPNDHQLGTCFTVINTVPIRVTTTWPNGKVSKQETDYDAGFTYKSASSGSPNYTAIYGKPVAKREYDYGLILLRTTATAYQFQANSTYQTENLLDIPSSIQVKDGGGTQRAYTTYSYDEYGLGSSLITTQHDAAPPDGTIRGNLTSVHRWLNTTGGYLVSTNHYFDTGTLQTATDPKLNSTGYLYSSTYIGAFPTSVTDALNQTTTYGYDLNSGLLTSKLDPNNQTTSFTYDNMWRIATISYADGENVGITHQETSTPFTATLTKKITASQNYVTTNTFDGVGRVSQSALTSDSPSATYTVLTYDGLGHKSKVYNPTRCSTPTSNCGESTWGYAIYGYDGLSRVIQVTQPDGSILQTSYNGNSTTVTDEALKKRTTVTDGLGRLTQVFEDPSGLNYETDYQYDALDDLTGVTQSSSRQRTFVYDSLKRLTSASNPESGTVAYTYDADGNVATKLDARSITTTYSYDALNRLTSKTYTDTTPTVTYAYDGNTPVGCTTGVSSYGLAIGRRTAMCDAGSSGVESWTYNDPPNVGWQTIDKRTTGSVTESITTQNNLAGSPATLTYPSGRMITYTEDGALHPVSAQDVANGITYASSGTYAPPGGLNSLNQGTTVKITNIYNSRLQSCWSYATNATALAGNTLCTGSATTGNIIDLKYNLALGTADNGNVVGITNNRVQNRSQSFSYDSLNRLTSATTTATHSTDPTDCWGEAYIYDNAASGGGAWGNLTNINVFSSAYTGCTQESLSVMATSLNRFSGYGYDNAGNMTSVPAGPTYVFNAENELTSTSAGVSYTYDGDGKRVSKSNGKLYWYGGSGDPIAETGASGNTTEEYIFFGGKRIARRDSAGSIAYYMADHLGTSRIVTNSSGSILDESDFYPFGGERVITAASGNTYKFTGKERDTESNLDDFVARYDSSSMGRFMSPDPLPWLAWQHSNEDDEEKAEEDHTKFEKWIANPQNLNVYSYVNNNPLSYTDPSGMSGCKVGDKTFTTCTITVVYNPATSQGTLTVTGQNKGDKSATVLLTTDVVVGGDGHVTPTGTFTASYWEKDHVSTKYGTWANTPYSKTMFGGNAFGPFQLHIKELEGQGIYIHGTMGPSWSPTTILNTLVSPTSHGCVRMCNSADSTLHNIMPNPEGNQIIISRKPAN